MTTGELTTIYAAGFALLAVIFFLVAFNKHLDDTRPMAKIQVRVDDKRRRYNPQEENDVVQQLDRVLVGVLAVLLSLAAIVLALSYTSR